MIVFLILLISGADLLTKGFVVTGGFLLFAAAFYATTR